MDLYQLRTFVAVAEERHLTRAAKRLFLSQPAVSGHIKALEQSLEVRLFDREPSGMTLTATGRDLLVEAQKVLAAAAELNRVAQRARGGVSGRLRIGTVSDPATIRVGDLMAIAVHRFPQLDLELQHEVSGAALDGVREGRLDASFYFGAQPAAPLTGLRLREVVYRVTAPAAWAERLRGADWGAIASMPWILTPEISTHYQLVQALFAEHELEMPQRHVEADDESVIINLVAAGVGLSLMPADIARERERAGEICIWEQARLVTTLWFVIPSARAKDPQMEALITLVRDTWKLQPAAPSEGGANRNAEEPQLAA